MKDRRYIRVSQYNHYVIMAERYGIPQYLAKPIAKKIAYGNPGLSLVEALFHNKSKSHLYCNEREAEIYNILIRFMDEQVPIRCLSPAWRGF